MICYYIKLLCEYSLAINLTFSTISLFNNDNNKNILICNVTITTGHTKGTQNNYVINCILVWEMFKILKSF